MKAWLYLIVFLSVAGLLMSQENTQTTEETEESQMTDVVKVKEEADQTGELDADMEPSEFVYQQRGRRDPFWDLLRGSHEDKAKREQKDGIAGLEIDQLELEGIVCRNGVYIALFKGPNGIPYDVMAGQMVYDGEIIKIDTNQVVFKKILTIALGGTKEKTIIKRLNTEKENEP